jgi:hypothetical protein
MLRSVAVLALAGCSAVFVTGPKAYLPPPPAPIHCTSLPIFPAVDTLLAAVALGGVIYFSQSNDSNKSLGMGIEAVGAVGFGLSAITGWRRVARCRSVLEQRAAQAPSPAPYGAPWQQPDQPPASP